MDNVELLNGLHEIYDKPFLSNLKNAIRNYPEVDFTDALSIGQIKSKNWLINQLHWETCDGYLPGNGMVFILGGWYGTLAAMMLEDRKYVCSSETNFKRIKIRSFDIDPECAPIADTINRTPWVMEGWQFKATTADMYTIDYNNYSYETLRANGTSVALQESPDVIINTSCEHLEHFNKWWKLIPNGKLCVLQTNDYYERNGGPSDHVNCVDDIDQFLEATEFTKVMYSGELELEKYTRYMIIGKK